MELIQFYFTLHTTMLDLRKLFFFFFKKKKKKEKTNNKNKRTVQNINLVHEDVKGQKMKSMSCTMLCAKKKNFCACIVCICIVCICIVTFSLEETCIIIELNRN